MIEPIPVEAHVRRTFKPTKVLAVTCDCGQETCFPLYSVGVDHSCRCCGQVFRIAWVTTDNGFDPVPDTDPDSGLRHIERLALDASDQLTARGYSIDNCGKLEQMLGFCSLELLGEIARLAGERIK